jgi:hypothetical protein
MLDHLNNSSMLYGIKGFCEVKLDNDNRLLRLLALVYVFECPSQTILNSSGFNEHILILMHQWDDY